MIGDVVIANVLASAMLVLLVFFFDFNEKEPVGSLLRIYIVSAVATFCFGKAKGWLLAWTGWHPPLVVNAFLLAGFFEEALKLTLLLAFAWRLKSFNEESDGIVYSLMVAAGFSILENIGYSFRFVINPFLHGMQSGEFGPYSRALREIVILRSVSGHIFFNTVSGFFVGLARIRHRPLLVAAGFAAAVVLHGLWNMAAIGGWIAYYALALLLLNAALVWVAVRSSFYFKFMKRLDGHVRELIRGAKAAGTDPDVVALMQDIRRHLPRLRRLEGAELNAQARILLEILPCRVDAVPAQGENGLLARLVKANGLLSRDRTRTGGFGYWGVLFLKFWVTGFVVLMVLMQLA